MEGAQSFCSLFRILTLTDWVSIFVKITIHCKNFKSNPRWRERSGVALMGPREGNMSHWPGKKLWKLWLSFSFNQVWFWKRSRLVYSQTLPGNMFPWYRQTWANAHLNLSVNQYIEYIWMQANTTLKMVEYYWISLNIVENTLKMVKTPAELQILSFMAGFETKLHISY